MRTAPCKYCATRHPNCHSECERYSEYKRELEEVHKIKNAYSEYAYIHSRQALDAVFRKCKKGKRR